MKTLFFMFFFLVVSVLPASSKTYNVISIQGDEAVIQDMDKKTKIKIKQGKELDDGWVVFRVDRGAVVVEKRLDDEERVRWVLPARGHQPSRMGTPE